MLLPLCLLPFSSLLYILYKRARSQASVYKLTCRIISFSDWPQVRECGFWNPESMKFCLWNPKSWALESGIQLKGSGIQNPSSTDKEARIQYLECGIRNPWRGILNPRLNWIPLQGTHNHAAHKKACNLS